MIQMFCDGALLYDPRSPNYVIAEPKCELEVNKTGNLTFRIAPTHPIYGQIQKLKSEIAVYQDNERLGAFRVLNVEQDFNNIKTVTCEGELAYLLDSIQRAAEYHDVTVAEYFAIVIANHNADVDNTCPQGRTLRHTTTDKDGKRTYRSTPRDCVNCPYKMLCGANEKGQKIFTVHIWQEYLDLVEQLRKTERGKELYARRKETIERVFADAKEKHAMRYTQHRGLAQVTNWVRLKLAAMNLKKLATWAWDCPRFLISIRFFHAFAPRTAAFAC